MKPNNRSLITEDVRERIMTLVSLRLPWLVVGLLGGILASLLVSRFEKAILANISLAFFVPLVVYMADAVGTQTETIYVRNLAKHKSNYYQYFLKELFVGLFLGIIFGSLVGIFAFLWLGSTTTALAVALAMTASVTLAPIVALTTSQFLYLRRTDPALGAGPFTTVIQDLISLLIYFTVATFIMW